MTFATDDDPEAMWAPAADADVFPLTADDLDEAGDPASGDHSTTGDLVPEAPRASVDREPDRDAAMARSEDAGFADRAALADQAPAEAAHGGDAGPAVLATDAVVADHAAVADQQPLPDREPVPVVEPATERAATVADETGRRSSLAQLLRRGFAIAFGIVLISGYTAERLNLERLIARGAAFVPKPVTTEELVIAVNRAREAHMRELG